MKSNSLFQRALLLIRTPHQARIASEVLRKEKISEYDMLYFSQHASEEDITAFGVLDASSRRSYFIKCPSSSGYLRRTAHFWWKSRRANLEKSYDQVLVASVDEFVITRIGVARARNLITFDDGYANFDRSGPYFMSPASQKVELYRRLFGAPKLHDVLAKIDTHYTLHPNLPNIVESSRLEPIEVWRRPTRRAGSDAAKKYFIGQPFESYLSDREIQSLREAAEMLEPDVYLFHPMETKPLLPNTPREDKRGSLAEDVILRNLDKKPAHVIGGISTVLLNLAGFEIRLTMLVHRRRDNSPQIADLASALGIELVWIN